MKKKFSLMISIVLIIILVLFSFSLSRSLLKKELDDVNPRIECDEKLLNKADVLWIIPEFNNESISENKEWCSFIISLNKTLGMHGVHHTFNEFSYYRDESYIEEGINSFQECFGVKPRLFKAPQLVLSKSNEISLEGQGFIVKKEVNQLFHKVYHCNDTGEFPNWFVDMI